MIFALTSGFIIGLMGSFHCLGMCGPLALALPVHHLKQQQQIVYTLVYNFGRVTSYVTLGLVFGFIGKSLFIGQYQQAFSITIGVLILLGVFVPKLFKLLKLSWLNNYHQFIRSQLSSLFKQQKSVSVYFLIGIFNGLLPCGLVYFALASALITGSVWHSVAFMFMFGIATIPMMFSIAFFGKYISQKFRTKVQKLIPYFIAVMAVLLVLRGLNLNIPYISPALPQSTTDSVEMCMPQ